MTPTPQPITLESLLERHATARQQAAEHARQAERWSGAAEELARLIELLRTDSEAKPDGEQATRSP